MKDNLYIKNSINYIYFHLSNILTGIIFQNKPCVFQTLSYLLTEMTVLSKSYK